ncbi:MAG: DUF58 domain-containing protein [Acidobacteriota bacterium]
MSEARAVLANPSSATARSVADPTAEEGVRSDVVRRQRDAQLGWAFALAFVAILLSAFSGGLFLYAAAVVVVVYVGAWVSAEVGVSDLDVWRRLSASEVELGGTVDARIMLHNRKSLPAPWLLWRDRVEDGLDVEGAEGDFRTLGGDEKAHLSYRLHPLRRGLFRVGPLVVESSDPLGLVRRYRVDDAASFVTVLPRAVPMGQGWPLGHSPIHRTPRRRSLFEDPSRFRGIRPYRPGDGMRRIHWRATARSGELQVKIFEPSVLDGALLAVDMGRRSKDRRSRNDALAGVDPRVELAVTAAASIGRYVLGGDQAVGLVSNGSDAADRYPIDWSGGSFRRLEDVVENTDSRRKLDAFRPVELEAAKGERHWQLLRTVLARLETARDAPTLPELLLTELPRLPRSLVLMVITSRLDGDLVGCLGALRRSGFELAVVWIAPGDEPPEASPEASVPVYRIARASDLERLGDRQL